MIDFKNIDYKKIDIKMVFIVILSLALLLSFLFGQKNNIDMHKDELENLHQMNQSLLKTNDSLINLNKVLDIRIDSIHKEISKNNNQVVILENEIIKLNEKRHEIYINVNRLSANDVAIALSNFLNKTKSPISN